MLKRIVISNYRSCLHTRINLHPNLTVLIGPNSSGKTNILQAIMLLKKLSQPTEHKSASEYPGALSCRVRSLFHLSGVQADLNAALKVFTDESNNDRVVDSKQSCLFTAPKRKKLLVKDPFHPPRVLPFADQLSYCKRDASPFFGDVFPPQPRLGYASNSKNRCVLWQYYILWCFAIH